MNKLFTLFSRLFSPVLALCKKKEIINLEDFTPACKTGNLEKIKKILTLYHPNLNQGLLDAVRERQNHVVEFLIEQGASNLDDALKIACMSNNFFLSEFLVQKGARTVVGLRVARSPNIIKMLYRYEQNSEVINY